MIPQLFTPPYIMKNTMKYLFFGWLFTVLITVLSSVSAQSQEQPHQQVPTASPRQQSVSFGLHYTGGDATFGRGTAMLSATYMTSITTTLSIAATLQSSSFAEQWDGGAFSTNLPIYQGTRQRYTALSVALMSDATLVIQPFPSVGFRVGIGPSVRLWQSTSSGTGFHIQLPSVTATQGDTSLVVYNNFGHSWTLGGHVQLEYAAAIAHNLELGVRGQVHIFAEPFAGRDISAL
jgi:hypothetical protein